VGAAVAPASLFGIEDAGRWTLTRGADADGDLPARLLDAEAVEHVARTLLRRYGVVCWRLLEREAAWLPPWRDLLRVYHRLEARGEIRGGRFIAGLSGEQFALPEAIGALRAVRKRPPDGALVSLSALDPLNLVGTVLAGDKVPRQLGRARAVSRRRCRWRRMDHPRTGPIVAARPLRTWKDGVFQPDPRHERNLNTLLDQIDRWGGALKPLRG
jgi:hypothetical protein